MLCHAVVRSKERALRGFTAVVKSSQLTPIQNTYNYNNNSVHICISMAVLIYDLTHTPVL